MISAIIITYFPDQSRVKILADCLAKQTKKVWIIDNSPSADTFRTVTFPSNVFVHHLCMNAGIAKAQNIAIEKAKAMGATDVVLFDQDSIPSPTLVRDLLAARNIAIQNGINVAAIGPVHYDTDTGSVSRFLRAHAISLEVFAPDFKTDYFITDFIIASGSLISIDVLDLIGLMEEDLFIDCVDIEWGYRARAKGLKCIVAQAARMDHKIGDEPLVLFGRKITTHSPLRHYYFFRNVTLLLKRKYMPLAWKLNISIKSILQTIVFVFFLSPRKAHLKHIAKGFIHGILGRTGPYEK